MLWTRRRTEDYKWLNRATNSTQTVCVARDTFWQLIHYTGGGFDVNDDIVSCPQYIHNGAMGTCLSR